MKFNIYSTESLIDCLPENRPLYKDSGLWQVRSDDMEYVFIQQRVNESFRDFIIRYLEWADAYDEIIIPPIRINDN